jgi:hypothetical protein
VTKSDLSVTISASDRNKMISCYAVNAELGETIVETHMVSVLCKLKQLYAQNNNFLDASEGIIFSIRLTFSFKSHRHAVLKVNRCLG